jgi:anti-sigma regulatory factor (Ser/Thr protein kinase)
LIHQALIYDSEDEYLSAMLPFVLDGLESADRVLVVTKQEHAEALKAALGADAGALDFRDAEAWYIAAPRTARAYRQYLAEHANGRQVRVVGEPVWKGRSPAAVREWVRYEAMVNVAFAEAPAWIVCPYDAREVSPEIVEHALHTHPELVDRTENRDYLDPVSLCALLDDAELEPPGEPPFELEFTDSVSGVRTLVTTEAAAAGVHWERIPELVLAVNEIAGNAIRHGGGTGRIRTWAETGSFVCEISDSGPGIDDPLNGYLEPEGGEAEAGGLWVSRQLAELLEIRADSSGTTVRIHTALA